MIEVKIIRWDKPICFPSGITADIKCMIGNHEEAKKYAEEIAKKHNRKVVAII